MKWTKPTLKVYDVAELTKTIIANAKSMPEEQCSCTSCSCSCAAACEGIFGYSCRDFFIIIG